MATLLDVVKDLCGRQNLPVPTTVFGSVDTQIIQIMKLLEEEGVDLVSRGGWQETLLEGTFTTTAAEDQGAIATLAPGFWYMKNQTIWDRTDRLPVAGPMTPLEWQAMKALNYNGFKYKHRIRGGRLIVNPAPSAGHSWFFEYQSKNWILDVDGSTTKRRFTADTDAIMLPDDLCLQGLRWRWKKEKGLDYAEDFRTYEIQVKDALGRNGGKPVIKMDSDENSGPVPGVWVSPYNTVS